MVSDAGGTPRSAGFSVLEAMVALVIFSGAALAFYGLLNTGLVGLTRAEDTARQMAAARYAAERLAAVNPLETEAGQFRFDGLDIAWSARLLEPVRRSQTVTGGRGHFEVGLFDVAFTVREDGRPLGVWQLRVPGYRKVRGGPP